MKNEGQNTTDFAPSPYQKLSPLQLPFQHIANPPTHTPNHLPSQIEKQKAWMHGQALLATVILLAGWGAGGWLWASGVVVLRWAYWLIFIGSYLLYLMVGCCNPFFGYLARVSRDQSLEQYYQHIKKAEGCFVLKARCFHKQRVVDCHTTVDEEGEAHESEQSGVEAVVTHTATSYLYPRETRDHTGDICQIRAASNLIFIQYSLNYHFLDPQSQARFSHSYETFKSINTRDARQLFSCRYKLPGLVHTKTYLVGESSCDYVWGFYVLGAVGLIWPFCLWAQSKVSRFRVQATKVLTM